MNFEWKNSIEGISWLDLADLYRRAPLGIKDPNALEVAFKNSMFVCFVLLEGNLIGAGRALADGVDCSYICDIAIQPEYQGNGLGHEVISKLVALSATHKKIILYSAPGKETFYKKNGFKKMRTAMAIFKDEAHATSIGLIEET
ncbi:Acetyltransferase, GNAT family [hydrothermal vent metagenome]|uniref:Acetyltransferase, GNAT family n=1 Tax=hydrothermal vent metagenome TaxID=652676 RepID=A0A3B0X2M8_9ZZZZ